MIEIKNLTKTFNDGEVLAVDNISFSVKTGEIACLIGTSGCGKTTTLKMINRLVEPTSGDIEVLGKNFQESDPFLWRRNIGYVVQKSGLLPHMTIGENINLLSRILKKPKKIIRDRTRELLDLVGMNPDEFIDRYPAELSGGQQQRVGIARALVEDPKTLLMDEPFGALDPITKSSLHEEFLDLNKKLGKTILMVTHDMDEAKHLGDLLILMDKGRIIQEGTQEQLTNNPENQFVEEFFEKNN